MSSPSAGELASPSMGAGGWKLEMQAMKNKAVAVTCLSITLLQALIGTGCASSKFPEISDEGLPRIAGTPFDAVYQAPNFDLDAYRQVAVDECSVQIRDNWLRDQNRNRGPHRRVTTEDMKRIEQAVAASCREIFAAEVAMIELGDDRDAVGEGTLAIRPEIVDLDITAPDVQSSGRETNFTTIPVQMSLRLELFDSETGQIVGRVIDHRRADTTVSSRQTSSVGNMADAERILRHWSALVRAHLESRAE